MVAEVAGFGAIFVQIGEQASQIRSAIVEGESRRFKTKLHQEGVLAGRRVFDRGSEFWGYILCSLGMTASADHASLGEPVSALLQISRVQNRGH